MKNNPSILAVILAALTLILSGCASITQGTEDTIFVNISNCSEKVECIATNKKGSWEFTAPGALQFTKSDEVLHIECNDGDHVLSTSVTPTSGEMIWGNLLLGGVIGAAADASSDSHWTTPDSITVDRKTCRGESIQ